MGDSKAVDQQPVDEEVVEVEVEVEVGEDTGWQEKPKPRPGDRGDDFEPESRYHG
jgi:hypothetical protein